MTTHILHEDATLRIAQRRNVFAAVWSAVPTVEQVGALRRATEKMAREHPGHVFVNLVVRGVPSFPDDTRDALVSLMRDGQGGALAAAHVLLIEGLAGSAVRAFLSTMILLSRPPVTNRVFGDTNTALTWLTDVLGATNAREGKRWTRDELREVIEEAVRGR